MNTLLVSFDGAEDILLEPGEELTFGRGADIRLDEGDDGSLHRLAGAFSWHGGIWWLHNLGSRIVLLIVINDLEGYELQPASRPEPLSVQDAMIRLHSDLRSYELRFHLAEDPLPPTEFRKPLTGTGTIDARDFDMSEEQRLLLTALCERRLLDPLHGNTLPSNEQIAARFGWTSTKFNRKLDGICRRLEERGVKGLVGDANGRANQRREVLVDCLINRTITIDDLSLLTPYPISDSEVTRT